jgi:hypothetical protein
VTGCVLSGIACARPAEDGSTHEPAREHGWSCCVPSHLRLASALNVIPDRVDELAGLGYVERDTRVGKQRLLLHHDDGRPFVFPVPGPADQPAHAFPAGPVPGQRGGARVHAAPSSQPPLSLDVVDLTSGVNHEARQLLARGVLGLDDDQVGHLSAATILHGWVRDWADILREGEPMPRVRDMCRWLSDRLDWAAGKHPALDEFAGDLLELRGTLTALTGRGDPPPETLSAPCPDCSMLSLFRDAGLERVVCGNGCLRLWTDEEYTGYARTLIKEAS